MSGLGFTFRRISAHIHANAYTKLSFSVKIANKYFDIHMFISICAVKYCCVSMCVCETSPWSTAWNCGQIAATYDPYGIIFYQAKSTYHTDAINHLSLYYSIRVQCTSINIISSVPNQTKNRMKGKHSKTQPHANIRYASYFSRIYSTWSHSFFFFFALVFHLSIFFSFFFFFFQPYLLYRLILASTHATHQGVK